MVAVDPDGWNGSYPVVYWDPRWKQLWLGDNGIVAELRERGSMACTSIGSLLTSSLKVRQAAREAGLDARLEMLSFIEEIRAAGRTITPDFLVVAQNAFDLLDVAPDRYVAAIDALAVEDTWFSGRGEAKWNSPKAGDVPQCRKGDDSTDRRLTQYRKYLDRGLPVFTVDYCLRREHAALVYREARAAGLRPLVTRVTLSRLTETPPNEF